MTVQLEAPRAADPTDSEHPGDTLVRLAHQYVWPLVRAGHVVQAGMVLEGLGPMYLDLVATGDSASAFAVPFVRLDAKVA